jgi:hypothetical protein
MKSSLRSMANCVKGNGYASRACACCAKARGESARVETWFLAGSVGCGVGVEVAAQSWSSPSVFAKGARASPCFAFCEGAETPRSLFAKRPRAQSQCPSLLRRANETRVAEAQMVQATHGRRRASVMLFPRKTSCKTSRRRGRPAGVVKDSSRRYHDGRRESARRPRGGTVAFDLLLLRASPARTGR